LHRLRAEQPRGQDPRDPPGGPRPRPRRPHPAAGRLLSFGDTMPEERQPTMEPLEGAIDHVRGPSSARVLVEYGDYECPYSRQAFRAIERVNDNSRMAFASPSGTSR